jgi:Flp pilus assembly pilin Flp
MLCAEVAAQNFPVLRTLQDIGFSDVLQQESTTGRIRIMTSLIRRFWNEDEGQDIAEYAVMLAVILVLVVGTIRLVGSHANNAFSSVASSLQ